MEDWEIVETRIPILFGMQEGIVYWNDKETVFGIRRHRNGVDWYVEITIGKRGALSGHVEAYDLSRRILVDKLRGRVEFDPRDHVSWPFLFARIKDLWPDHFDRHLFGQSQLNKKLRIEFVKSLLHKFGQLLAIMDDNELRHELAKIEEPSSPGSRHACELVGGAPGLGKR